MNLREFLIIARDLWRLLWLGVELAGLVIPWIVIAGALYWVALHPQPSCPRELHPGPTDGPLPSVWLALIGLPLMIAILYLALWLPVYSTLTLIPDTSAVQQAISTR